MPIGKCLQRCIGQLAGVQPCNARRPFCPFRRRYRSHRSLRSLKKLEDIVRIIIRCERTPRTDRLTCLQTREANLPQTTEAMVRVPMVLASTDRAVHPPHKPTCYATFTPFRPRNIARPPSNNAKPPAAEAGSISGAAVAVLQEPGVVVCLSEKQGSGLPVHVGVL